MLARILISLLLIGGGYVIVWKAQWFFTNFGAIPFAEKHLVTEGGSRMFYKLIGILFILIGALHLSGLLEPLGRWVMSRIFGLPV